MKINGTGANDSLNGTGADDTILAVAGNDTVRAGAGADFVDGGLGTDQVYGEDGADILWGGDDTSADSLFGGAGDDTMLGGPGADQLDGGAGDDVMGIDGGNSALGGVGDDYLQLNESSTGSFGRTFIDGGAGDDFVDFTYYQYAPVVWVDQASATGFEVRSAEAVMLGDVGGTIHGGANDDVLFGGGGDDQIEGGSGADWLSGGGGANRLVGGAGDDVFVYEGGVDTMLGGAGTDTVDFTQSDSGVTVQLAYDGAGGGMGFASIEKVFGSDHADTLEGDDGDNTLIGGADSDELRLSLGHDQLDGGDGDDRIEVNPLGDVPGAITVDFSISQIELSDGSTTNFLHVESIIGGEGDDTFIGGAGDDHMKGRGGIDTASYALAAAGVRVNLTIDGEDQSTRAGLDSLSDIEVLVGSDYNDVLTGGSFGETVLGGAGDDKLFAWVFKSDALYDGGEGIDTLSFAEASPDLPYGLTIDLGAGTAQAETSPHIIHFSGIEKLTGSVHDDLVYAGAAGEIIDGGPGGVDTISYEHASKAVKVSLMLTGPQDTGGSGVDKLSGFERLVGSAFADSLTGAAGATVSGAGGDDVLISVGGNELSGGDGADLLIGAKGDDRLTGGDGVDTASYARAEAGLKVSLLVATAQNTGAGLDTLQGIENLLGGKFADRLIGDGLANALSGGAGADTLDGGDSADLLDGGAGRDVIIGGLGGDVLRGGKDNDVFLYRQLAESAPAGGVDKIMDFKRGDLVSFAQIDADTSTGGDQAFHLVSAFTGHAGEAVLVYDADKDMTRVLLDQGGDRVADMEVRVMNDLHAWDFVW